MRKIASLVLAILIVVIGLSPVATAQPPTLYASVQEAIDRHVVPAFEHFKSATATLASDLSDYCSAPTMTGRTKVDASFASAATGWAAIEFLRFGPLGKAGRPERVSFWPDPRGMRERQLRPVLSAMDAALLDPQIIAKQSVAIQGLPALEQLLNDATASLGGKGADSIFRCKLASSIAANVALISSDLSLEWTEKDGWRDKMLRPGSDNDTYREPAEAAAQLLKSILTGLQVIAEQQVRPRIDAETKPGKRVIGPFEKSGLAGAYFASGINSISALYAAGSFTSYLADDKAAVAQQIAHAFAALGNSDGAGGFTSGQSPTPAPLKLADIKEQLGVLRKRIASDVADAAGVTIGFNELDGD